MGVVILASGDGCLSDAEALAEGRSGGCSQKGHTTTNFTTVKSIYTLSHAWHLIEST